MTCLPADLPEFIEVDLSALALGDIMHMSQIVLPKGVTLPALAHGGKHLPSPQELASRTGSSLEHLTHLQTATRTPVSLNAVLDDDSDFKLTEAMPDNTSTTAQTNNERQEALGFLMENLRPRERKVLDLRFGLTGSGTHSLRQIGHLLRISKERVRQIQNRALEKLRASAERVGWEPSLLLD